LAKASFLLEDHGGGGGNNMNQGDTTSNFGGMDYRQPIFTKGYSQAPMSYGGNTRSQYTGSEIDSDYETHSQF
jgi:hypothetical protein